MSDSASTLPDFYRGDTYPIELYFSDPADGSAIDITGYVFTVTLKSAESLADVDAELQTQATAAGAPAAAGTVEIRLESDETNIAVGEYFMDIQRTIAGSPPDVLTVLRQKINVLQDITLTP